MPEKLHLGLIQISVKKYVEIGEEPEKIILNLFPEGETFVEVVGKNQTWKKAKNPVSSAIAFLAEHIEEEGTITINTRYYVND